LCFKAASIYADVKVEFYDLFNFLSGSGKGMHYSSGKPTSILLDNIKKLVPSVTIVQIHWQLILFCQIKMIGEYS
jgi:hypothetical protein